MVSASVLTATEVATDDIFGQSVSASDSASGAGALVGATGDDDNGDNSGAAVDKKTDRLCWRSVCRVPGGRSPGCSGLRGWAGCSGIGIE
ncbi:MAG: FG-GAP repeat protein [Opitutaceae bacterium]|nr:FG-GAP repeat protein [Opitutaceae bacterium]